MIIPSPSHRPLQDHHSRCARHEAADWPQRYQISTKHFHCAIQVFDIITVIEFDEDTQPRQDATITTNAAGHGGGVSRPPAYRAGPIVFVVSNCLRGTENRSNQVP